MFWVKYEEYSSPIDSLNDKKKDIIYKKIYKTKSHMIIYQDQTIDFPDSVIMGSVTVLEVCSI